MLGGVTWLLRLTCTMCHGVLVEETERGAVDSKGGKAFAKFTNAECIFFLPL